MQNAQDAASWVPQPEVDNAMAKALARAFRWRKNATYVGRLLRLTLLAPEIIEVVLDGEQPKGMRLEDLLGGFPVDWAGQRLLLG